MAEERSIADELDVQRVLYDYAWACDNGDWHLLASVFTADAHVHVYPTVSPPN